MGAARRTERITNLRALRFVLRWFPGSASTSAEPGPRHRLPRGRGSVTLAKLGGKRTREGSAATDKNGPDHSGPIA
jgi:hypothetical protein